MKIFYGEKILVKTTKKRCATLFTHLLKSTVR